MGKLYFGLTQEGPMAKQWIQITKESAVQLATQIHDAELLAIAIRPDLVRIEIKRAHAIGGGKLQLQFLGVSALRSSELWKQNVFAGLEMAALGELPEVDRQALLDDDASLGSIVFTLPAAVGMRLQVACESGWTREPR